MGDEPPNTLKDSNVSFEIKTSKEGVGVHSLDCNILRVKGAC